MSNYVLALIVGGASLPYIVRLICCGMALWLSRNDVQLRDQLFKTMLTLIARGPSKYDFAIRAIEAWKQFRPANESPPAGTPPILTGHARALPNVNVIERWERGGVGDVRPRSDRRSGGSLSRLPRAFRSSRALHVARDRWDRQGVGK
jgi:hypothetical protein